MVRALRGPNKIILKIRAQKNGGQREATKPFRPACSRAARSNQSEEQRVS